jgi:prepilin-type N-terminal cleavage/methylation domain-containing protein
MRAQSRPGFTLLELMLAVTILLLLLAALGVAIDMQYREMAEGRSAIEDSSFPRLLLARMTNDLTASVGPIEPLSGTSASGAAATGAGSTTAATNPTTTTTTSSSGNVVFQIGLKGDSNRVAIYRGRLSRALINPPMDSSGNNPPPAGDVWRVCYFMAQNGGLARQEVQQATADIVDDLPTDVDDYSKVLAPEVESASFRYYDGTTWQDSWDGSTPGPDGVTPQGPPRSVEVTLNIRQGGNLKTFVHVIAFPTAPGPSSQGQ